MNNLLISLIVILLTQMSIISQTREIRTQDSASAVKRIVKTKTTIRGRAFYEDTGFPVRRGKIGLFMIPDLSKKNNRTVIESLDISNIVLTDENGEFEIEDVGIGKYHPFVKVRNVISPESVNKFYERISKVSIPELKNYFQTINVDGSEQEIQILVPVKRGGSISGRVLYDDGSAAIDVGVYIFREGVGLEDRYVSVAELKTDDRGHFRFIELFPGKYKIKVVEPSIQKNNTFGSTSGYSTSLLNTFYPGDSKIEDAGFIDVSFGQEITNSDVTISERRLFRISGKLVTKDTKEPLKDVNVNFQKIEKSGDADFNGGHYGNQIRTDELGRWSFKDLPKGLYRIEISHNLFVQKSKVRYAQTYKEIRLEKENVTGVNIEVPLESSVSGIVKVESNKEIPSRISIYLLDFKKKILSSDGYHDYLRNRDSNNSTHPKKKWKFRVGSLSEGNYKLRVSVNDETHYVKSIKVSTERGENKGSISVGENENVKNVEIILADDIGTLKGQILKEHGTRNNIGVVLIPTEKSRQKNANNFFQGTTNRLGNFEIKAAPGEYFVTFPKKEYNDLQLEETIEKQTKNAKTVSIKPDETSVIKLDLK